jgi:RIO-like serine/threonine protein kinase
MIPATNDILKKRKLDWEEEFEVEKAIYRRVQPLQGKFIPYFYGEATYDGSPALVLSEIVGQRLSELTLGADDDKILETKLKEVYKALSKYGVTHEDAALHNVIDIGDRINNSHRLGTM